MTVFRSDNILVFSEHMIGASHIKNEMKCQDYSESWMSEDKRNIILALSDGHGSKTYVRSDVGSHIAVETAMRHARSFIANADLFRDKSNRIGTEDIANFIHNTNSTTRVDLEQDSFPKPTQDPDGLIIKMICDICADWKKAISEDAVQNPFSDSELQKLGNNHLVKAYGCTLLVYLQTPEFWLAFQIGDGRILFVDQFFNWSDPVPWDPTCFQNITTSLCQDNPELAFRYAYDGRGAFPAGAILVSDGIEDSYGDYETDPTKLHSFLSGIISRFVKHDFADEIKAFREFLPLLSERGSKDDLSISAYLNCCLLQTGIELIETQEKIDQYSKKIEELHNQISETKDKLKFQENELNEFKKILNELHLQTAFLKGKISRNSTNQ